MRSGDGQEVARTVRIDTTGPVAVAVAPADGAVIARDGGATAQFACLDAGSGATSCGATLTVRPGFGNAARYDRADRAGRRRLRQDRSAHADRHRGLRRRGQRPADGNGSSSFSVVPPPRVDTLSLPGSHTGTTRSVGAAGPGVPVAGPFTTTWEWGDGTTTTCTTGQTSPSCSSSIAANGAGTSLATHTYPAIVERDAQRHGDRCDRAAGDRVHLVQQDHGDGGEAGPRRAGHRLRSHRTGRGRRHLDDPVRCSDRGTDDLLRRRQRIALCTATTGPAGKASCGKLTISLVAFLSGSYTATFAGDSTYKGVNTTAQMLKLF